MSSSPLRRSLAVKSLSFFDESPDSSPPPKNSAPKSLVEKVAHIALKDEQENTSPSTVTTRQFSLTPAPTPLGPLATPPTISDDPFIRTTPEKAGKSYGITKPHRPSKKGRIVRKEVVFHNPIQQKVDFVPYKLHRLAHFTGTYEAPSGKTHYILRQTRETSCGATALLMLYTSQFPESSWGAQANKTLLSREFWVQYSEFEATSIEELAKFGNTTTNIRASNLRLEAAQGKNKNAEEAITDLKERLIKINQPVIFFVSNKEFTGHWVVIDQCDGDNFYIRDPYTAKAYKVSGQELFNASPDYDVDILFLKGTGTREGKGF